MRTFVPVLAGAWIAVGTAGAQAKAVTLSADRMEKDLTGQNEY